MKECIIDSVMDEIRAKEEQADVIIEEAKQRGKDMTLVAQADADRRIADCKREAKELRRASQQETARRAAERREALMRKGEAAAKELIDNKNSAVEDAADAVVAKLIQSYK